MLENSYNDGNVSNIKEMTEEERKQVFKDFSEGDKNLEQALIACFESGISTKGCCKGHLISREDQYDIITGIMKDIRRIKFVNSAPYIQMEISSENLYIFFNLMQKALETEGIDIILHHYNHEEKIIFYAKNILQRKNIFKMISREVKNMMYYDEMSKICQEYWNLHSLMISSNIQVMNMSLCQKKMGKIYFSIESPQSDILEILLNNGMKKIPYTEEYGILVSPKDICDFFDKTYDEISRIYPYNESNILKIRKRKPIDKPLTHFEEKRTNMLGRLRQFVTNSFKSNTPETNLPKESKEIDKEKI